MSAVSKTQLPETNGWTVEQTIQGLEGRNAARRGEPFTHANGPYWSCGWLLGSLGIDPLTRARVRMLPLSARRG